MFTYLLFVVDEYDGEHTDRFVMVLVVMLISDLLHVLHFLHHYILKKVEIFLWFFKLLPAKIDNDNDFKNNKL